MPANAPPTALDLQNAGTDIDTLGKVINEPANFGGSGTVSTRRGGPVKTLAWYLAELNTHRLAAAALVGELENEGEAIALLAAALAPGQPLDRIASNLNSVISASGVYPIALGEHDSLAGTVITDPRVTVIHEDARYRPRVLPHTITLPFDADDWYLLAAQSADTDYILAELRSLRSFHPARAPVLGPLANRAVQAGFTGLVVNLSSALSDADTSSTDFTWHISGLPAGFSQSTSVINASGPAITAPVTVSVYVTDQSGLASQTRTFQLEVTAAGVAPTIPPVFGLLPTLQVFRGNPVLARDHKLDVLDPDSPIDSLTVTGAIDGASGVTFASGVRGGRGGVLGTYTASLAVTDASGNSGAATYSIQVIDPSAPTLAVLPFGGSRTVEVNTPPVEVFINAHFNDENTPADEFITPLSPYGAPIALSGAPPGSTLSGFKITLTTATPGNYRPQFTVTNRAGKTLVVPFDFIVTPASGGGGGGGGGGDWGSNFF